jgi:hypothetical protein
MTFSHHDPSPCQWFSRLAAALDRRSTPGLIMLFLGTVLARGRRTVSPGRLHMVSLKAERLSHSEITRRLGIGRTPVRRIPATA